AGPSQLPFANGPQSQAQRAAGAEMSEKASTSGSGNGAGQLGCVPASECSSHANGPMKPSGASGTQRRPAWSPHAEGSPPLLEPSPLPVGMLELVPVSAPLVPVLEPSLPRLSKPDRYGLGSVHAGPRATPTTRTSRSQTQGMPGPRTAAIIGRRGLPRQPW